MSMPLEKGFVAQVVSSDLGLLWYHALQPHVGNFTIGVGVKNHQV
jgi:hypothetical protein